MIYILNQGGKTDSVLLDFSKAVDFKIKLLWITNKRKPIISNYRIHNENLESVDNAKYFDVIINKRLKSNTHIKSVLLVNVKRVPKHIKIFFKEL